MNMTPELKAKGEQVGWAAAAWVWVAGDYIPMHAEPFIATGTTPEEALERGIAAAEAHPNRHESTLGLARVTVHLASDVDDEGQITGPAYLGREL